MHNLAVIIVHYGNVDKTKECLTSVFSQSVLPEKIIVVDNSGNLQKMENIIILKQNENRGFARAVNIGIKKAIELGFERFLIMNNDVYLSKNFLSKIEKITQYQENVIIVPQIRYFNKPKIIWFDGGKINLWKLEGEHFNINKAVGESSSTEALIKIDFFTGACFYLNKNVFEKIGKFDEKYFLYYEDLDYSFRTKNAKVDIVYVSNAICFHAVSFSTSIKDGMLNYRPEIYYYRIRNKIIVIKKYGRWFNKFTATVFLVAKFLKYFWGLLLLLKIKQLKLVLKGLRDGIINKAKIQ